MAGPNKAPHAMLHTVPDDPKIIVPSYLESSSDCNENEEAEKKPSVLCADHHSWFPLSRIPKEAVISEIVAKIPEAIRKLLPLYMLIY